MSRRAGPVWAGSLRVLLPARAEGGQDWKEEPLGVHPLVSDGYLNDGLSLFCVNKRNN